MNASVFIATSLDGFIARANGELDWLPPGGGEEHGYDAFMATVDALVIGRKTFETVLTFATWPYGEKPVFVAGGAAGVSEDWRRQGYPPRACPDLADRPCCARLLGPSLLLPPV